jgi:hypothetical protein
MGSFLIEEAADVATVGRAGRVVVGRGAAGRGARTAAGSGRVGRAVARSGAARSDRLGLAPRGRGAGAPVDCDGGVCALDDRQAAHGLGIRDVGAGGLRLAAPAPFLSDRAGGAGAARVDGAQADPPAWGGGGGGANALRDRRGPAGDALQGQGRADRLDGRGSRCAIRATPP